MKISNTAAYDISYKQYEFRSIQVRYPHFMRT